MVASVIYGHRIRNLRYRTGMLQKPSFYPRQIGSRIVEAMRDTPVVLLAGPRHAGKTTLVRQVSGNGLRYLTLDDELTLMSARENPRRDDP